MIMETIAKASSDSPSIESLAAEVRELREGLNAVCQRLMDVREVLASGDLPPRLRNLLGMYPLPASEVTVQRCIGDNLRDTHVAVTAFVNVRNGERWAHSSLVEISELPNDLVGLDDLKRAGIDPLQFKSAVVKTPCDVNDVLPATGGRGE